MSKKGKRLREFEKKNRTFNVRETKKETGGEKSGLSEVVSDDKLSDGSEKKEIKKKKRTFNVPRLAVSTVVLVFIVSVGVSGIKLLKLQSEKDALVQRQQELEQMKEDLTAELEHIDSAEYMEQQARKNLRLIRENEILFLLPSELEEKISDESEESDKE